MKEIIVQSNEAGQRLDKLLSKYLNLAPRKFICIMLRKKNIKLNGKKADGSERLSEGDSVKLFLSDETISSFSQLKIQKTNIDLDIIYEDNHVLIINKPAGMLSQKAQADDVSINEHIISYLLEQGVVTEESLKTFRPAVCNRLDRNTSGIIVAGKTLPALQQLSSMFKHRTLDKYYICIVKGVMKEPDIIEGYLYKEPSVNRVIVMDSEMPDSRFIQTEYMPIKVMAEATLLSVKLITGRSHQIRAHLAGIGHPIIGDSKYGNIDTNRIYRKKYHVKGQLLHACELRMPDIEGELHDLSGKRFVAKEPDIFKKICNANH